MSAVMVVRESSAKYLSALQPPLVQNFELMATAPDGVARLREMILTLAVQGMLVPQDPREDPASELLNRIRAEKDMLVAKGKIKPEKVSNRNLGAGSFDLPEGWQQTSLGDYFIELCTGPFGAVIHKEDYIEGGVPLINPSHMIGGRISHDSSVSIKPAMAESLNAYRLSAGDILLARRGEVGRYALVTNAEEGWLCGTGSFFVKLHESCNRLFLGLVFQDPALRRHLLGESVGATMTNLNQRILLDTTIAVPPLAEQSRIVTRVEELMRLCDALEAKGQLEAAQHAQLVQTLLGALTASATPEELADNWQRVATHFDLLLDRPEAIDALEKAILQLAVRGLLVPQDPKDEPANVLLQKIRAEKDRQIAVGKIKRNTSQSQITETEKLFSLPENWEWARLGDLANFIDYRGKTPTKTKDGVPLITAKNVRQGFINRFPSEFIAETAYESWMTRGFPRIGDLLFTTEAPLGNVAQIDIPERFALAQRVICFGLYELEMSGTLAAFIQSPWMQAALAEQASGVTAQGIKSSRLQSMPIPVPPLSEQSRIVARVESLRRLCVDLRQRLAARLTTQAHLAEALIDEVA